MLRLLLLNSYSNDLFYLDECTTVCNNADDTTFRTCDLDLKDLIRLENDSLLAIEWLIGNEGNEGKCHLLMSGYQYELLCANIGRSKNCKSEKQKLLGILRDRNLCFDEYILLDSKKAGSNLSALVRICKFITIECRGILMKAFTEYQFGYCPPAPKCYNRR